MKQPNDTVFYTDLFSQLNPHSLVVTPTQRAATRIQREYAAFQLSRNTYSTGNIVSLPVWIEKLWQQYQDKHHNAPQLLTSWQTQCVWQDIIRALLKNDLLSVRETSELAQQAWALLQMHQIALDDIITPYTEEVDFLKQCAQAFQTHCRSQNIITSEMLPIFLAAALDKKTLSVSDQIFCVGFDYFSPALQALLTACEMRKTQVIHYQFPQQKSACQVLTLKDAQTEWLQAAMWAKEQIAKNPAATIGIVIPQISTQWQAINTLFARELSPHTFWSPVHVPSYNISAGKSLNTVPIIKAAFQILNLDPTEISMSDLSNLLLSPFLRGSETEYAARARLDSRLRRKQQYRWRWSALLSQIDCAQFHTLITQHLQAIIPGVLSPHDWRDEIIQRLTAWGWPGELGVNTIEYQAVQRFLILLDEFALLSQVSDNISFSQALSLLTAQASQTIFQRETHEARIHILGVLEASGLMFDALWISGVHEKTFPAQLKPNPLLPIRLQLKYKMQEACYETCYQFYQKLFTRLLQSAPIVKISYPQQEEGVFCEASPFLKDFVHETLPQDASILTLAKNMQTLMPMETGYDEQGPSVRSDESVKGGTGILQSQANCPFQAFVRYRLQAKKREKTSLGLTALQRGQLVHDVLAKLWETLKTQATLLALSEESLQQKIGEQVDAALKVYQNNLLPPMHLQIEKQRLTEGVSHWLALEKKRASFTVAALEAPCQFRIGNLPLDLRIDRIDTTEQGAMVLDYKTGEWGKINWFELRPDVAQLLVYALCVENCTGVALGLVQGRQPKFAGTTEYTHLPGVKHFEAQDDITDWHSLKKHWQSVLENLANHFCAGDASITPKNDQTCSRCEYGAICRIEHIERNEVMDES